MLDQVFFWNFIAQFLNVKVQKLGAFNSFNWEQALVGSFSAMLKFSSKVRVASSSTDSRCEGDLFCPEHPRVDLRQLRPGPP